MSCGFLRRYVFDFAFLGSDILDKSFQRDSSEHPLQPEPDAHAEPILHICPAGGTAQANNAGILLIFSSSFAYAVN